MTLYILSTHKSLLFITLLCLTILSSCNEPKQSNKIEYEETVEISDTLSFQIAKYYFAKNKVDSIHTEKIETLERFNEMFGSAAVMGMDTTNFPINFINNYALTIILPETNLAQTITPFSLVKKSTENINFNYQITTGEEQTFSIRPCLIIVVNKSNDGNVIFKNITESEL